jgi:hypothetical protein
VSGFMRMKETFSVRKEAGTHTQETILCQAVFNVDVSNLTVCTVHKHVLPASEAVRLSETVKCM